jgi:DNA-binding winged helix-turn-helix (wHTH) protein/Flp pilus assembly protein TadD
VSATGNRRIYCFSGFRLDAGQRILQRDAGLVPITPKAVDVLIILVERAGEVVDKETLFRLAWPDTIVVESSLTKIICLLRKTLDEDTATSVIQTVSKRGYRFTAAVTEEPVPMQPGSSPIPARTERPLLWRAAIPVCLAITVIVYARWREPATPLVKEAQREYLIGRYMANKTERAAAEYALARFQKAAELNPAFALAHAGIADAYNMMATLAVGSSTVNRAKAQSAAERAVSLAGNLADPHLSLARARLFASFDSAGAEQEYRRALEIDPNSTQALHGYACLLAHSGRFREAGLMIRRAQELDPASPQFAVAAARIEYYAGRHEHALEQLRAVVDRDPDSSQAHYYMAMALGQLGRIEPALEHLQKARLSPALIATDRAWLLSIGGDRRYARALLAERQEMVREGRAKPTVVLLPALDAGDRQSALSALEEMWKTREVELLSIKVNPRLDPIRNEPRFQSIAKLVWPEPPIR